MIPIRREWSAMKRLALLSPALAVPLEEATASGNPVVFLTDVKKPLKSLLIPFTPKQSGTGDPSPQNIRSILPWNGLKVWQAGKNLANMQYGNKVPSVSTGQMVDSNGWSTPFIPIDTSKNYYLSRGSVNGNIYVMFYGSDYSFIRAVSTAENKSINTLNGFSECSFIKIRNDSASTATMDVQLEVGQTASTYEAPHITETDISFPSPVYGGEHEAVSGKMNVPVAFAEFDGSDDESWNVGEIDANKSRAFIALAGAPKTGYNREIIGNYIKPTASAQSSPDLWTANINASGNILIGIDPSITTVEGWKAYLAEHPLQIVYPLATPQEIQLTPTQITALVGDNTIWSDADGSMTAVYLKKK